MLKPALAAVVRALRDSLDLSQEELASAVSQTFLSRIENGHSSPTMDKFAELADALQLSPVALMALILSTIENTPTSIVLANAARELEAIEAKVSAADIAAHLAGNEVLKRPAARPADLDKLRKVLQCKADGLSKSESARRLGLSRSTIGFLWERSVPDAD
ncbi:helix-turn-helix domain-containing protein [Pseudomonas lundensis]|uniref:helix-turn-helix domain-containing protein n=1 Tax=Pseudomonas lundensis TaxID=86185 RepID=UPI0030B9B2D0